MMWLLYVQLLGNRTDRDAGAAVGQGGSKGVEGNGNL